MESLQELLNMEEVCHKILLILLKYIPFIIAIVYLIVSVLRCFGVMSFIMPNLFFMSPITALFMIVASFAFRFCIWHRLPIYYALLLHGIDCINYYCTPITNNILLFVYLLITIVFIIIGMYLKNRYNKKKRYG